MSDLFTPPRFFKNVKFHRHTDRAVGWLELFYDLVYVATFIQIGNFLSDNVTWLGFAQSMLILAVVWWAWTGETFYQNRFYVDDLTHRILVFIQIFAIASIGLSVSAAFGELYVQFTIAYVVTRLMLVLMYLRSARAHPESRELSKGYAVGFSIGICIWLGSLILPEAYHWVGWAVGIGFELCVPLLMGVKANTQTRWAVDVHHISERFGIFTIILLGESFVKILDDAQGNVIGLPQLAFSTVGLIVLYSLWWLYFSDTAGKLVNFSGMRHSLPWVYGHLPLSAGLLAFGVAAKKAFAATSEYPGDPLEAKYRLLYTAAVVLYLVALGLIDTAIEDEVTHQSEWQETLVHWISAIVVAILGLTLTQISPTGFVAIIAVIMVVQVGISVYLEQSRAGASSGHEQGGVAPGANS